MVAKRLFPARKGTNGVSTNGVTAIFMFFDRGVFWVLPLTYLYLPKSASAYLFPQSVKISGPISVDPICPQPITGAALGERWSQREKGLIGLIQNNNFQEHFRRKQNNKKLCILGGANVSVCFGFYPLQSNPLKPFSQQRDSPRAEVRTSQHAFYSARAYFAHISGQLTNTNNHTTTTTTTNHNNTTTTTTTTTTINNK